MKGRNKKFFLMILGILICCAGIYVLLSKYYFFNKYNVYERRQVLNYLNRMYNQEFELLSIEFKTTEVDTKGARYIHMWTFTFQDDQGREFYAYDRMYGLNENEGAFYHPDYYSNDYIDDTYAQLCVEESLGDNRSLYKYRQKKGDIVPYQNDYIFICTKDNANEIAEILTEIYFAEDEFSNGGCLRCMVNSEEGKELFSYHWWTITRKLQKQGEEISEQTVYAFIMQELKNSIDEGVVPLIIDNNIALNESFVRFIAGEITANSYESEEEKYLPDYYEEHSKSSTSTVYIMSEDLNEDGEDELLINMQKDITEGEILVFHSQDGNLLEWESIRYGMHSPKIYLYDNIVEITGTGWSRSFFRYNSQGQLERVFDCSSEAGSREDGVSWREYTIVGYQDGIEAKELSITEVEYSDKENDWEVLESSEEVEQFDRTLNEFLDKLGTGKQINQIPNDAKMMQVSFIMG